MMTVHRDLAAGRWFDLPLVEQLAHVGSEVERMMRWRGKGNEEYARLRELTRLREVLADFFWFDNRYGSTDESWRRYFHAFTHAAALGRGR
ncbi:MAG: hypothetical protein EHM71_06170 [Zetaproteobacteria bacterium]|nr:MAG: hypothetical protein EHM71_06170 [Zetaproteobacteria bacterium]